MNNNQISNKIQNVRVNTAKIVVRTFRFVYHPQINHFRCVLFEKQFLRDLIFENGTESMQI